MVEKGLPLPNKPKKARVIVKEKNFDRPDFEPEDKIDDFKGWANFPKLCMKIVTENPYLFDAIKCETLRWEFRQKDSKRAYKKEKYMGPLAGLIGELVRGGQASAKEGEKVWVSGILGPHDLQGLLEMHRKDDRNLQDKDKDKEKADAMENKEEQPEATDGEKAKMEEMEGGDEEKAAADGEKTDQAMDGEQMMGSEKKEGEETKTDVKIIHKIMLPGVSRVYSSYEEALEALPADCQSKQEGFASAIFEVDNVKCYTGPKDAKYVHRLFCALNTHETISLKQKVTTVIKKKPDDKDASKEADSAAKPEAKDSEEPDKQADEEVREHE